jgi:hypothetical protein
MRIIIHGIDFPIVSVLWYDGVKLYVNGSHQHISVISILARKTWLPSGKSIFHAFKKLWFFLQRNDF